MQLQRVCHDDTLPWLISFSLDAEARRGSSTLAICRIVHSPGWPVSPWRDLVHDPAWSLTAAVYLRCIRARAQHRRHLASSRRLGSAIAAKQLRLRRRVDHARCDGLLLTLDSHQ